MCVNVCEGCLQRLNVPVHVDLCCAVSLRRLYCFTLLLVWAFPALILYRKKSSKSILALPKVAWVVKLAVFQSFLYLGAALLQKSECQSFRLQYVRLLVRTIILPCTSRGSVVRGRYCTNDVYTRYQIQYLRTRALHRTAWTIKHHCLGSPPYERIVQLLGHRTVHVA
jgi:hypothetical protein